MRLGCFADAHVGAFPQYADDRLAEQEAVLAQAVEVFNDADVDAILFAGDATHRNKPSPAELLAFVRPLLSARAPVLAINGNTHDVGATDGPIALDLLNRDLYGSLRGSGVLRLSRTPEILEMGALRVATLPWAHVGRLVAAESGGDRDEIHRDAADHLIRVAAGLRAKIAEEEEERGEQVAAVLVTHFAISGDQDGLADLVREPVLPVEELGALGFDAVVAGHFHHGGLILHGEGDGADPPIFYCGSPYPLSFGEADYEHGVWLLDIDYDGGRSHDAPRAGTAAEDGLCDAARHPGDAAGIPGSERDLRDFAGSPNGRNAPRRGVTARFIPLESRRFRTVDADLTWLPTDVDPTEWLAGIVLVGAVSGTVLKVRYTVTEGQRRRMDEARVRRVLLEAGAHRLFLEPDVVREERARGVAVDETLDVDAALGLWLAEENVEAGLCERARGRHAAYAAEAAGGAA